MYTSVEHTVDCRAVVVSHERGRASVWRLRESAIELDHGPWAAHAYPDGSPAEVWCATRGPGNDGTLLLTGADDAALKAWDARSPGSSSLKRPSFRCEHGAGVTAARAVGRCTVLTAAYDDMARLWDVRRPAAALCETSLGDGGGCWRPRAFSSGGDDDDDSCAFVAPAGRSGAVFLRVDARRASLGVFSGDSNKTGSPIGGGHAPEAITYGVDFCRDPRFHDNRGASGRPLLASCSFYDNALHLWRASPAATAFLHGGNTAAADRVETSPS
mmetsp:Transcript_326/g.1266  ORF Transcript_326/g.1266 Transcript_326/m.1266 type:complete len:272 (-) Transcript_326:62-877(-)